MWAGLVRFRLGFRPQSACHWLRFCFVSFYLSTWRLGRLGGVHVHEWNERNGIVLGSSNFSPGLFTADGHVIGINRDMMALSTSIPRIEDLDSSHNELQEDFDRDQTKASTQRQQLLSTIDIGTCVALCLHTGRSSTCTSTFADRFVWSMYMHSAT